MGGKIEKQHAGTSMNDKHEQGRGTGIVRIRASVTWMKSVQQIGVLHQNHLVPESDVLLSWHQWRPHSTYKKLTF